MGREAASSTCRVRPLELGQDGHIKPSLDSIKSLRLAGGGSKELHRELWMLKVKMERGSLCS